ncbi:MAG: sulfotransferase domain-containing protein [Phycisphaerales bacterium]|nr:sulfotransferase domain-containing protein [Hyphomonadaceae bacterium]
MEKVGFAVGTGRCGTKFLAEVLARDPSIASHHERHAFNDTFHRYCRWYDIPVDDAGFLATKAAGIEYDLRGNWYSFEASSFLSMSIDLLHEKLGAKIVVMVRSPAKVVASYLRKGWYENPAVLADPDKPPTMQQAALPHHFLGRTMPRGAEFERWNKLTRVGKLAWYWNMLNSSLVEQAERMPRGAVMFQKLEDLDYSRFQELLSFLGAPTNVTEMEFATVRGRRPNASHGTRTPHVWSETERREFEIEVCETAEHFGYPWRISDLTRTPGSQPMAPSLFVQAKTALAGALPWIRSA